MVRALLSRRAFPAFALHSPEQFIRGFTHLNFGDTFPVSINLASTKMVDESAPVATTSEVASAKPAAVKKPAKAKNSKPKPDHPSTADMVNAAIKALAERNGSSLQAIKKYVGANYKVDAEKHAIFIRRYLKTAVTAGTLVQTKGKGASGSFKLAVKKAEVKAKPKVKAASKETSPKKTAVKKPLKKSEAKAKGKKEASPKKGVKKTEVEKLVKPKAEKVAKAKSPSKAKKATKGPTTKPKSPKPKKATASKAKPATKKVIAQKK